MLMRLMSKGEYLIVPKGTKFTGSGKLGLIDSNYTKHFFMNKVACNETITTYFGCLVTVS